MRQMKVIYVMKSVIKATNEIKSATKAVMKSEIEVEIEM